MSDTHGKTETVTLVKTDSKGVSVVHPEQDIKLTMYYDVYRFATGGLSGFVLVDERMLLEMVNQINSARQAEKRRRETEGMESASGDNSCLT